MDKNTLIGLFLIGFLFVVYSIYQQPSEEQIKAFQHERDSIAQVEASRDALTEEEARLSAKEEATTATNATAFDAATDSSTIIEQQNRWGLFAAAATGENEHFTLENELMKVTLSTLGGRVASVELKNYKTHDSLPLMMCDEDSSKFSLLFYEQKNRIETSQLFFTPINQSFQVRDEENKNFSMRLYADSKDKYVEYAYSLKGNSYEISCTVNVVGLNDIMVDNDNAMGLEWSINALNKEKNIENERNTSSVYYKYMDDEVDYISETKSEVQKLEAKTQWIAFKQQYFTSVIISDKGFDKIDADVETKTLEESNKYTCYLATNLTIPFEENHYSFPMRFYYGPCHYQTLRKMKMDLEEQINLGPWIIGWISQVLVIPIFNYLDSFDLNYGIIILILTLIIKTILFPITYKTYLSSAKMRVLKPEIDELSKKFKKEDAMKKQQATMALYKQAGVNPMAGCIPMLIQLPILYAMFRFFPSSIELRQQGFLWAHDLSTYDSILELGFEIPAYGSHVSLFTLLMAASTFIYTKYNTQMTMTGGGMQAQQMKIMTYFMPFMLLVFFNKFSSGLSYYYFLANVISIGQNYVIKKWFVDEDAIHKKIQEHKKKPNVAKKSKFQKKLEDMAKKKGYKLPNR